MSRSMCIVYGMIVDSGAMRANGCGCGSAPPDQSACCSCVEDFNINEWEWSRTSSRSPKDVFLSDCCREVTFHKIYSTGTAAVKGSRSFVNDYHYYWEIKILSTLYGTDVMIGVGTENVDFNSRLYDFTSLLGLDSESYGLSYLGKIQHNGNMTQYNSGFAEGAIVGVYLDMWHGTLEFFINRKPMGIAFRGLKRHSVLYPMVSSTASQSAVRLIYSTSRRASLLFNCTRNLTRSSIAFEALKNVPGLKNIYEKEFWIFLPSHTTDDDLSDCEDDKGNTDFHSQKHIKRLLPCPSMFPKGKRESQMKISYDQICTGNCKNGNIKTNVNGTALKNYFDVTTNKQGNHITASPSKNTSNVVLEGRRCLNLNEESDEELWLDALAPNATQNGSQCVETSQENVVKFSTRLNTAICQNCNKKLALTLSQNSSSEKCLKCIYDT